MKSVILCCLLALTVAACGQTGNATYRLAPEDTISIKVLNLPEFSGDFLIPQDGALELMGVGRVVVSGKTIPELTALITDRLSQRLRRPEVVVTLRIPRMQRVYVFGAVTRPGIYDVKPGWRITEALAAAGGLAVPPDDVRVILLRAASGQSVPLSMPDILAAKETANLMLEPGDVCTFEPLPLLPIYVMGAGVRTPGLKDLRAGLGVQEALALAGGLTLPLDEVQITITRAGKTLPVDMQSPPLLQRGDVLTINSLRTVRVMVTGKVRTPGVYDVKETEGIAEALTLAGGSLNDLVDGLVVHTRGQEKRTLSLQAIMAGEEMTKGPLTTGDILLVESQRSLRILISGKVARPGFYDLKPGEGVVEALTLAGGAMADSALGRVKVTRAAGTVELVDLSSSFLDSQAIVNVPLQHGDLIVVPESTRAVAILGYVQQPGYYPLRDGKRLTVSDAISLARGAENQRGGLNRVAVVRTDEQGAQVRMVVDLAKFFKTGDLRHNPDVQAGDIIYVPKSTRPDWNLIFQTLTTAAVVYNVVER